MTLLIPIIIIVVLLVIVAVAVLPKLKPNAGEPEANKGRSQ